jgi:hypothetical protein
MSGKQVVTIAALVIMFAAGVFVGLGLGRRQGETLGAAAAEKKLQPLIDLAFPKPPAVIKSFGGTIKDIFGAKITLEIRDPDDYLPHLDGTQPKKELRSVLVASNTKITLVDYTKKDAQGNSPLQMALKLSDLKVGDQINVRSDQNIRDAKEFIATEIELIKY